MDNIISESEPVELPELNFGIPQSAEFVTERRQANFYPSGSSNYSPKDNKNIRFYISGDANQYLDLSSVRFFATIQNCRAGSGSFTSSKVGACMAIGFMKCQPCIMLWV